MTRGFIVAALVTGAVRALVAQPVPDPARFEKDIAAFEAEDRTAPPAPGGTLFVGSSSIRYWDVAREFPALHAIKRGYGGSHVSDTIHFAPRIVFQYRPSLIVFYAGDADVAAGKSAVRIADDTLTLVRLIARQAAGNPGGRDRHQAEPACTGPTWRRFARPTPASARRWRPTGSPRTRTRNRRCSAPTAAPGRVLRRERPEPERARVRGVDGGAPADHRAHATPDAVAAPTARGAARRQAPEPRAGVRRKSRGADRPSSAAPARARLSTAKPAHRIRCSNLRSSHADQMATVPAPRSDARMVASPPSL